MEKVFDFSDFELEYSDPPEYAIFTKNFQQDIASAEDLRYEIMFHLREQINTGKAKFYGPSSANNPTGFIPLIRCIRPYCPMEIEDEDDADEENPETVEDYVCVKDSTIYSNGYGGYCLKLKFLFTGLTPENINHCKKDDLKIKIYHL